MTDAPALPARVRLSRLPGPPGQPLLGQLQRVAAAAGQPELGARLSGLGSEGACWVALAGGRPVALLLAGSGAGETACTAVDPGWRGRGLEEALARAARAAS